MAERTPQQEFEVRLLSVERKGVYDLWEWLQGTDFLRAPASTRWHGAHEGGLVEHSLAVHDQLVEIDRHFEQGLPEASMALCALLHDVCKADCYVQDFRNVKDERGQWHRVPCYRFEEKFPFGGHGSKSLYLVQHFVALEPEEAAAINCHMGMYDSSSYSQPGPVYGTNALAWLLHVADEAATYIDGR